MDWDIQSDESSAEELYLMEQEWLALDKASAASDDRLDGWIESQLHELNAELQELVNS